MEGMNKKKLLPLLIIYVIIESERVIKVSISIDQIIL
jgi:hypothetical protein